MIFHNQQSRFVRESRVMIQPQSLVESQTTSDKSHIITKRTIQSIRWDEFHCERYFRSFSYVCKNWYNISLRILSFTPVQSNHIPFHSSLNVSISTNSLKHSKTNSRDIPNELIMLLYDSRTHVILKWIEFAIFLKLFITNPVGYERFESNSKYLREHLCSYVSICVNQICCAGIFLRRISLVS